MDFDEKYFQDRQRSSHLRSKMYKKDFEYCLRDIRGIRNSNSITILDVGCADGKFTSMFSEVASLFGVETNELEAEKASQRGINIIKLGDLNLINPDVIILRGTLQHITPEEFDLILNYQPNMMFFLQTPNPASFVYKLLKQEQIAVLSPNNGFQGNRNLISLNTLEKQLKSKGFKIARVSKPYFTTPYCKPLNDLFQLVTCLFDSSKKYGGSWKGNIYRVTATKGEINA